VTNRDQVAHTVTATSTGGFSTGDIDFRTFREHPRSPEVLRCLRYLHDVETHTVRRLRDMLVTRADRDPEVTAFLTLWNHEEFWHGGAIAGILRANQEQAGPGRIAALHRIMKQEGHHTDFYSAQARSRLGREPGAQRLTRWALIHFWAPVGSGVVPDREVDFLRGRLFGGDEGRAVAERIDCRVDRLPRLEGLNPLGGTGSAAA
jgi:hypothetical protein